VTLRAVQKAIEKGRIQAAVTHDERGVPKIADVTLADREWLANTDVAFQRDHAAIEAREARPAPAPVVEPEPVPEEEEETDLEEEPAPPPRAPVTAGEPLRSLPDLPPEHSNPTSAPKYAEARAIREAYAAKTARLDYEAKLGKLVSKKDVEETWANIISLSRTKILSIPSKAKLRLPNLTHADIATLEVLVRESLEDLANSGAA
jgi:phage terminase Nu1 subunit (DNA packaging protein)